jgi:hypothetical protein
LVVGELLAATPADPEEARKLTDGFAGPALRTGFASLTLPSTGGPSVREIFQRPPPTNLVITLRHLVI